MSHPYQDSSRTPAERARDLLARMTLDEKLAQLHSYWLVLSEDGEHRVRSDDPFIAESDQAALRERLRLGVGQITRPLGTHAVEARRGVRALNRLQRFLREETRLGIPAMSHEEALVGLMAQGATLLPSSLACGATWNPDLVERAAAAIGREARSLPFEMAVKEGRAGAVMPAYHDLDGEPLDATVLRVLTEKLRLGIFERPYADEGAASVVTPRTALERALGKDRILEKREAGAPVFPGDTDLGAGPQRTSPVSPRPRSSPKPWRAPGAPTWPWSASATWPGCSRPGRWVKGPTPTRSPCPASSRSCWRRWWPPAGRWWW